MSGIFLLLFVSPLAGGFSTLEGCHLKAVTQQQCVLPNYPKNGGYFVTDDKTARPGDVFDDISLVEYTRDEYFVLEIVHLVCVRGAWSREVLKRVPRPDAWKQSENVDKNLTIKTSPEYCKLPPYPQRGLYVVAGDADAKPGDERRSIRLEYACDEGYSLMGKGHVRCENGTWYDDAPQCMNITGMILNEHQVETPLSAQIGSRACRLPPYPGHGFYKVLTQSQIGDSENYTFLELSYLCHDGYAIYGNRIVQCLYGKWFEKQPTCVESCYLDDTPGILYLCKAQNSDNPSLYCPKYHPNGAGVIPLCQSPYYNSSKPLFPMKCVDGQWNYKPVCSPECGTKATKRIYSRQLLDVAPASSGGWNAKRKEFPWHAGIYIKENQTYIQKCGGSIISPKLIVTAAHCFWKDPEGLLPSSLFAVAAGKLYQPWNETRDIFARQTSDVDKIVIPERFRGEQSKFQHDIAIMYLSKPFVFGNNVWPVCVDFDRNLDETHLTVGNFGKVAGWGLIDEEGSTSPILQVVSLPYVGFSQCYDDSPADFRPYISGDKICAGYTNGTALCKGDSGGGLVFARKERQFERYYLRGVASAAPSSNNKECNTHAVPTFTHILQHEHFIKAHLNFARM